MGKMRKNRERGGVTKKGRKLCDVICERPQNFGIRELRSIGDIKIAFTINIPQANVFLNSLIVLITLIYAFFLPTYNYSNHKK